MLAELADTYAWHALAVAHELSLPRRNSGLWRRTECAQRVVLAADRIVGLADDGYERVDTPQLGPSIRDEVVAADCARVLLEELGFRAHQCPNEGCNDVRVDVGVETRSSVVRRPSSVHSGLPDRNASMSHGSGSPATSGV